MKRSHHSALFVFSKGVLAHPVQINCHSDYGRVEYRTSWGKTISVFVKTYQYTRRKYEKEP